LLSSRTAVFRERVHYLTCAAQTEREINRWKRMKDALDDKVTKLLIEREELEFKIKFGEEMYVQQCAKRPRKKLRVEGDQMSASNVNGGEAIVRVPFNLFKQ